MGGCFYPSGQAGFSHGVRPHATPHMIHLFSPMVGDETRGAGQGVAAMTATGSGPGKIAQPLDTVEPAGDDSYRKMAESCQRLTQLLPGMRRGPMATGGPRLIEAKRLGDAWLAVCKYVLASHNEVRNLVVVVDDPVAVDPALHGALEAFCRDQGLKTPKQVAYTIFPRGLARGRTAWELFDAYNRRRGFFDRVNRGWGTYFRRMTHYEGDHGSVNQLGRVIDAINSRDACHRAAYAMVIQHPGGENVRTRGAPCLNYLALQMQPGEARTISLLAVYRNHDVVERAYGNLLGLGWLLGFLCAQTGSRVGELTCLSSHAYIDRSVRPLRALLQTFGQA